MKQGVKFSSPSPGYDAARGGVGKGFPATAGSRVPAGVSPVSPSRGDPPGSPAPEALGACGGPRGGAQRGRAVPALTRPGARTLPRGPATRPRRRARPRPRPRPGRPPAPRAERWARGCPLGSSAIAPLEGRRRRRRKEAGGGVAGEAGRAPQSRRRWARKRSGRPPGERLRRRVGAGAGRCAPLPVPCRAVGRGAPLPGGAARSGPARAGPGRPPGCSRGAGRREARRRAGGGPRAGAGPPGSGAGRAGPRPASAAAAAAGPPPLLPAAPPGRGRGSARPGAAAWGLCGRAPRRTAGWAGADPSGSGPGAGGRRARRDPGRARAGPGPPAFPPRELPLAVDSLTGPPWARGIANGSGTDTGLHSRFAQGVGNFRSTMAARCGAQLLALLSPGPGTKLGSVCAGVCVPSSRLVGV